METLIRDINRQKLTGWLQQALDPSAVEKSGLRRAVLALAAIGFVAGIVLSVQAQPALLSGIDWSAIALMALVAIPLTLALNAVEFILSARLVGQSSKFGRALELTIIGSAANLLPLPGAALVRVAALKSGGATVRSSLWVTAVLAALTLGLNLVYSAGWATSLGIGTSAVAIFALGALMVGALFFIGLRIFGRAAPLLGLCIVRIGLIALDAARTWLAFLAIGFSAGFEQASVLAASTALAGIVAIVPAGLGLREAIAALMAPFAGIDPAAAFLATSLSRIVGLSVVMLLTMFLGLRRSASP